MSACAWWLYSPKGENRDCRAGRWMLWLQGGGERWLLLVLVVVDDERAERERAAAARPARVV